MSNNGIVESQDVEAVRADVVRVFIEGSTLTPLERAEVLRMSKGYRAKTSAAEAEISPDTVRTRRKRIYRKLGVRGHEDLLQCLLASALARIAELRRTA